MARPVPAAAPQRWRRPAALDFSTIRIDREDLPSIAMAQHVGDGTATDAGRVAGSADHRDERGSINGVRLAKRGASMSCCEWFADMGSPDPFVCGRHDNLLAGERARRDAATAAPGRPVGQGSRACRRCRATRLPGWTACRRCRAATPRRPWPTAARRPGGRLGHHLDDQEHPYIPGCTQDSPPPLVFTASSPPGAMRPPWTNGPPSPLAQKPRSSRNSRVLMVKAS